MFHFNSKHGKYRAILIIVDVHSLSINSQVEGLDAPNFFTDEVHDEKV